MHSPTLRSVPFWIAVTLDVILAIALISVFFGKRTSTDGPAPQPTPVARATPAPVEPKPEVVQSVTRASVQLWFRIVDETGAQPIALAHVVLDNGNLAPELGDDSDAVTWPDGRAIITHTFFAWAERRGDQTSQHQFVLQGPWIHVTAEGYEPRKVPLSEVLRDDQVVMGPSHESTVTLRRRRADELDLADIAADYRSPLGFVSELLEVTRLGRYHYKWQSDARRDAPHDEDRYESQGRCSMVNGVLRLIPEGPFSSDLRGLMKNDFVPVRWGDHRFVIAEKDRAGFVNPLAPPLLAEGEPPRSHVNVNAINGRRQLAHTAVRETIQERDKRSRAAPFRTGNAAVRLPFYSGSAFGDPISPKAMD